MPNSSSPLKSPQGIIAIGNLLVDQSLRCKHYPEESMLVTVDHVQQSCGGGCTNVLFNLAKMDNQLDLSLCGIVGQDAFGDFILKEAVNHGINTHKVEISPTLQTSFTKVMVNGMNGKRTFFHYPGANQSLTLAHFENLGHQAAIVHVAYLLLLSALEDEDHEFKTQSAKALASLQAQGYKVSLDLVSDPEPERYQKWIIPVLPYVDYLIINDIEAAALTGIHCSTSCPHTEYIPHARCLLDMGVKDLVCIHTPSGAVAVNRQGECVEVPCYYVPDTEIVSTLGAGDAFCAGVLYGIHAQYSLKESLKLGCASAHFNLFSHSATEGAKTLEELHAFIQESRENRAAP